jgi:Protein of unknown function (DUF4089)
MAKKRTKSATRGKGKAQSTPKRNLPQQRSARRPGTPAGDRLDAYVDAAARLLDLPLEPAWKPAIKANLELTLRFATTFSEFPLPDDAEPAPIFTA